MICLFADLSLLALNNPRHAPPIFALHLSPHTILLRGVDPRRMSARMFERFAIPYRDYNSNPIAAVFARGVASLLLRASTRFKNLMRPTGEASGPVSGDFVLPS
jgi:hypothetical protein